MQRALDGSKSQHGLRFAAVLGLILLIGLLSAPRAHAVPIVTYKCTPAPQDCSGWYRSNVSIDWTVLPSDAVVLGCQDKTYTLDTSGTNELCSADDGVASVAVQLKIRVDQTPPEATGGTPSRPAGANGWYSSPVGITFSGTDQTSGVESCTAVTYSGPDSAAASLSGTCRDKAGNVSAPFPYGLKYDETDPSVTGAVPERPANASGWFNQPVAFDVQGTDTTAGIASCSSTTYSGPDSASASFGGTCTDRAGNSAARNFGLKYDATAPTATGAQAARDPDTNGWYRSPVGVSFSGNDGLSGIRSCTTLTYDGPDSGAAAAPGTCTDQAGNVSQPLTFKLSYDATAPRVTGGQAARSADSNGWYNHDVGVAFSGSDDTSGVQSCTATAYRGPDDGSASVPGTCVDRAGNTSSALGLPLKFDETGPDVTGATPDRSPDANGWYNHAVGFGFAGADATSGLADCAPVTYQSPDASAATVTGTCRDRAGNSTSRQFALKYDATPPAATGATPQRAPNAAGWYNRPVLVTFGGADQTSGVDLCTSRSYDGPDSSTASLSGTCTDRAGNRSASRDFGLKYDETAPGATGAVPDRSPNEAGWYRRPVEVAFSGADTTSGIDACGSPAYDGPDTSAGSVSGTCTDRAGNTSSPLAFHLKYDATDPDVTSAQAERQPELGGWFLDPVRFDFTGADQTSGVDSCASVTYAGPDGPDAEVTGECRDRANNVAQRAFPLKFDGNPPGISDLHLSSGDRRLDLAWHVTADVQSVEIARTPAAGTGPAVLDGPATSFTDQAVENGVSYTYKLTARDIAGNLATDEVTGAPAAPPPVITIPATSPAPQVTSPRRRLFAPPPGAVLRMGRPPLLRWVAVRRASYFNLQVSREGHKVLSAWPTRNRYQLRMRWRYAGHAQRLEPGRYRWIVWPGYGPRARADYGEPIGRSTFVIRR